ncbi:hypothetical protein GGF40_002303 [Coemansia sp. RSA 1286]|nr:hypothetical protein GGF40_002303 [Coemansia sp. RSA 1286]
MIGVETPQYVTSESSSVYSGCVAELCQEEVAVIQEIVQRNPEYVSKAALISMVKVELPLCLEQDIDMVVESCLRKKQALAQAEQGLKRFDVQSINTPVNINGYPFAEQISKWSPEETQKLYQFLDQVDGRKNWSACARFVGTKTSAQCKAKFNNMRAQDIPKGF